MWTSVILDYGLVLCLAPTKEALDRIASVFGVDHATFWSLYEKDRATYDRGDLTGAEYWARFANYTGVRLSDDTIRKVCVWDIEMWSRLNEPLVQWARDLRSAGYRTAILSNLHKDFVHHVRSSYWSQHFDCPVFSSEVRCVKPDEGIYDHCLRSLNAQPSQAIFLDDREANIRAAKQKGITALHYTTNTQLRKDLTNIGFDLLPAAE